jgi:hypothetical protein
LDANFATPITLGNTAVQLGNTITTVNNLTLANVTISSASTAIPASAGGTGLTSPGTAGNVLTSNGTAWISQAAGSVGNAISNGNSNVSIASTNGNVTSYVNGNLAQTLTSGLNAIQAGTVVMSSYYTMRNKIINGSMQTDQRNSGSSQTYTAAAAIAYNVDRFYGSCTGANVTGQQVTGPTGFQKCYQFSGAASVTQILFGQRIESLNCYDLVNQNVTLSANISNSLLTTVTWTAYYANSTDNFSSKTQIATGTFTVTSSAATYQATFNAGSNAGNGIAIEFTVGAQTSGTWKITGVQLELGTIATPFEYRNYQQELAMCQRYYFSSPAGWAYLNQNISNGIGYASVAFFPVQMRAAPTTTPTLTANNGFNTGISTNVSNVNSIVLGYTANTNTGGGYWGASVIANAEL